MAKSMNLQQRVSRILIDAWDPLYVKVFPENVDEYDEQARALAGMLTDKDVTRDMIEAYLKDSSYHYSNSWDDTRAISLTVEKLWGLRDQRKVRGTQ